MRTPAYLLAAVGTAALASTASASVIFTAEIIANNADTGAYVGSETWQFIVPSGNNAHEIVSDGWGSWQFGPGNEFPGVNATPRSWGDGLAMVHGVGVAFREDPQVQLNFNVASGFTNMTFTVNSSIVSFFPLINPTGYASAFVGLTDSGAIGTPGSITFTGLQGGNQAYASRYNPTQTTFANLITGGTFAVGNGGSTSMTDNFGSFGSQMPITGAVNEIRSQYRFTLSAGDRASGTSVFEVTPAPSSVALLGLGSLLAARRRRS